MTTPNKSNYFKRNNGSEAIIEHVGFHESGDYLCRWIFGTGNPFRYHKFEFEKEFVPVSNEIVDKLERQYCGRRGESIAAMEKEELPDYWREYSNGDKTCSFCGSLHPDSVLQIIKNEGFGVIGMTDKNYKWYITRNEVPNAMSGGIKYYRQHDTDAFIDAYNALVKELKDSNSA